MAGFRTVALATAVLCLLPPVSWCAFSLESVSESIPFTIIPTLIPESSTMVMSTTTETPPTTPTPMPSTTQTVSSSSPSPSPSPSSGGRLPHYAFEENDGYCVNISGYVNLVFSYPNSTNGKKTEQTVQAFQLNTTVDEYTSSCDDDKKVVLSLNFYLKAEYTQNINFTFTMEGKKYGLSNVSAILDLRDDKLFPHYNSTLRNESIHGRTNNDIFDDISLNRSYACNADVKKGMTLSPKVHGVSLDLRLSEFQAQAFSFKNDETAKFDKSSHCSADQKTSKIVPIAVGAALAGLVIVVLIAYLIGRFRSRKQQSYEALS